MFKTVIDDKHGRPKTADGRRDADAIEVLVHALERVDPLAVLAREPDSERAAAFRVLRHRVVQSGNPRAVLVSSPRHGEGKTLTAVNLALALGECSRAKVLLVEAHLAAPRIAQMFGFQPPWCFSAQLAAHREQPMQPWKVVNLSPIGLHVVAVDPRSPQKQLIDAPAFTIAMERFRDADYDYIVVDGPPVIGTAEVNLLQDSTDAVLLTTKVAHSNAADLRTAKEQLAPSEILGVVLVDGETGK